MSDIENYIQLLFQFVQWVGSFFGLIGGIILILRYLKERPILKFNLFSTHEIDTDYLNTTVFHINLDIDNRGDKPTSIRDISFIVETDSEGWDMMRMSEDFEMIHIKPRTSHKFEESILFEGIFERELNLEAYITHTHGTKIIKTQSYYM